MRYRTRSNLPAARVALATSTGARAVVDAICPVDGTIGFMQDAIERYRIASEAGEVDGFMSLLATDAELVSPISGRMVFRGRHDLRLLFDAVYGSLTGLVWQEQVTDGNVALLRGEARIGPFRLGDAMVIELAPDGRIRRIRPHFRPLLGLLAFAVVIGAKMGRHPAVLVRALRRP